MAQFTQSTTQTLLAHQEITRPANVVGTPIDVSTWIMAQITAWIASISVTPNATGVAFILQGSIEASGNDWFDLFRFTGTTATPATQVLTETEAIGQTVLAMGTTAGMAVGDFVYIKDDTGVAESEWHEIVAVVANTSITIMDGLAVEKVANDDVYDQAQKFAITVDCAGLKRIRACVVHQAATGSDLRVKCTAVGATDFE